MYITDRLLFEMKEIQKRMSQFLGKTIFKPIRKYRKRKLTNRDFSIISNNCWGGRIYQKLDLPYTSPTVGVYFYAEDYIKFITNMEYYLSITPKIISKEQSKYARELSELKVYRYFPVGLIDDVEVVFLHYRSDKEAIEKWERRKRKVNLSNLIVKFNDQNGFSINNLIDFEKLPYKNKICFVAKQYTKDNNLYILPQKKCSYVKSDMRVFKKPINMINFINQAKKDNSIEVINDEKNKYSNCNL